MFGDVIETNTTVAVITLASGVAVAITGIITIALDDKDKKKINNNTPNYTNNKQSYSLY